MKPGKSSWELTWLFLFPTQRLMMRTSGKGLNSTKSSLPAVASDRPRTRGEMEAAISRAFIQLEKESTGRGPTETRTFLIEDMVLVRLKGVMTPAEIELTGADQRGAYLIKQARLEITNGKRAHLDKLVQGLLGVRLRGLH